MRTKPARPGYPQIPRSRARLGSSASESGSDERASRCGARFAAILEQDGSLKLREMDIGEQREVDPAELPALVIAARKA